MHYQMLFFGSNSSNQFVIGHVSFEGTLGISKFNAILGSSISIVVSMFQNLICLLKFSWVKLVADPSWKIHMVHYKACLVVEGKGKKLNLKFDGLLKPIHKQNSLLAHPIILISEYYKLALITNIKSMKMLIPPMVQTCYGEVR